MPLNGDVNTFPLSAIVQMIHDENKTGTLTVETPRRRCSIFFKEGKIIHVKGNRDKELTLGSLLKANNLIAEDRLEDMLAVCKAMQKRLGAVLLERNYITADKLASILKLQVRELVSTMLSWDEARYFYKDGLDGFREEVVKFELDPVRLVSESKRREEFRGIIPNDQVVFQLNPSVDSTKSVYAARDLRVLLLLDGRRSVAQIIKETGYSRLAAYRSLAKLYGQHAIVRKDLDKRSSKPGTLELSPTTSIYLSLLQLIMADLAAEIGERKAATSLEKCLKQSPYYQEFLRGFQLDQDLASSVAKMQDLLNQNGQSFSSRDLINAFNQVVVRLLAEEYEFLGYKAAVNTLQRLRKALEQVPATQRHLAQAVSRFLEHYESEYFLRGVTGVAATPEVANRGVLGDSSQTLKLNDMSGTAIINFYNDMFQVVIKDLESEVGAKARGLLHGLIRSSPHSESIFAQFEVQDISPANPLRLKDNISTGELKIRGQDLVQTFQQVLRGLLLEAGQLLGPKATEMTLSRLMEKNGIES